MANLDILTAIGIAVTADSIGFLEGRHVHEQPKDYAGPETERIPTFDSRFALYPVIV